MRISEEKLNKNLKKQIYKTFFQTLCDLKNPEEIEIFLNDFFNQNEMETYAKRLAVAYWLKKKRSYQNIKTNLKVSSATISSVQNLINTNGLKLALKKIEAEEWATQWTEKIKQFVKK